MIKQICVSEIYSEEDLNTLNGKHFGDEWIHQLFDEDIDIFKGITFRSNYYQELTDVSPAFDIEKLMNDE